MFEPGLRKQRSLTEEELAGGQFSLSDLFRTSRQEQEEELYCTGSLRD